MSKRKFIRHPEIHPLLPTPEKQLIALNPSTKKVWLRALRSGDYRQGRNWLRRQTPDGDYYCCLGVYADLVDAGAWITTNSVYQNRALEWNGSRGTFPAGAFPASAKAVFMQETKAYGKQHQDVVYFVLMKANDGIDALTPTSSYHVAPATFEQIALWIERYL